MSCATLVIVKWQRSSIMEKKSIMFFIAITTSVELLLIMISMAQGTFIGDWRRCFRKDR
jgi:hypothetical protein